MTGNITPEDQRAFNIQLINTLERLRIAYAIGGSVAAMAYSEYRFIVNIDVMIDPDVEQPFTSQGKADWMRWQCLSASS